jgi:hypothetical protein
MLSLDTGWKFKAGDDLNWGKPELDGKDWLRIWPYSDIGGFGALQR